MGYLFAVVVGYLLGSSNMAFYLSRLKKTDLRNRGSGNLGTCNTFLELGKAYSVLVFLHDAGKAVLAVLLTAWLFPNYPYSQHVAGVFAVLGHIFPFYLKFKGGKGHAAYIGMAFALNWWAALIATPFCIAIWFVSDYMVGLIVSTVLLFPSLLFIIGEWTPALITSIATAFVLYRHTENFKRIMNGTEAKFFASIFAKKKAPAVEEITTAEITEEEPVIEEVETEETAIEEVAFEEIESEEIVAEEPTTEE